MRKTFKSVCAPGLGLNISPSHQGIAVTISMDGELLIGPGITLSAKDAASIMLAVAEAAGVAPWGGSVGAVEHGTAEHLSFVLNGLRKYQDAKERITAEAKARAELEAEALGFFNEFRAAAQLEPIDSWDEAHPLAQEQWLAVARKAREMRAEK